MSHAAVAFSRNLDLNGGRSHRLFEGIASDYSSQFGGDLVHYDVVVAGAGPAGAVCARELSHNGFRVLLIEEHSAIGDPLHCSGLVSRRTLTESGVGETVVSNRIKGVRFHSYLGEVAVLTSSLDSALVIDRPGFDRELVAQAENAGAFLSLRTRLEGVEQLDSCVRLRLRVAGKDRYVQTSVLVGADGVFSTVARVIASSQPAERVIAIGGEVQSTAAAVDTDFVEVFIRPDYWPGWYGWTIPVDSSTLRFGVGTSELLTNRRGLVDNLLVNHPVLSGARLVRIRGGVIPLGQREILGKGGVLLVGDAAGQVKPVSGGGIYTGVLGAKESARAIAAVLGGSVSYPNLAATYENFWHQALGWKLRRQQALRWLIRGLGQEEVHTCLSLLSIPEVSALVGDSGDIDQPDDLFIKLLRPKVLMLALNLVPMRMWPKLATLALRWYFASRKFGRDALY